MCQSKRSFEAIYDISMNKAKTQKALISLTKLMVLLGLLRSMVTNKIAFNQRDSKSISNFERAMDRCY